MNISISVRAKTFASHALRISIRESATDVLRHITRTLFRAQVLGNPLHEAWTADGEPLERMTPVDLAKQCTSRTLIVPHSRGR